MRKIVVSLLSSMLFGSPVLAAQPDLTTTAAFDSTCAAVLARDPATVQEQQAYVICNDVALVQQGWTSLKREAEKYREQQPSVEAVFRTIRTQLASMRDGLRKSRAMLEKIELRSAPDGLLIAPAAWVRDLDGDGAISTSERYFFAIPARSDGPLATGMPSEDAEYYSKEYNLKATIRLDQTDIYWALAYHHFIEAVVEAVLSYDFLQDANPLRQIRLVDRDGMRRVQERFVAGFQTSERMRIAALEETDDDKEWLPNPRQANTVFPVPLDGTDFNIWKELLSHLIPLVEGRTLLPISPATAQDIHLECPAGRGLDLAAFWREPPEYLLEFFHHGRMRDFCRKIDAGHPASGLEKFTERFIGKTESEERMMRFLRYWLWIN